MCVLVEKQENIIFDHKFLSGGLQKYVNIIQLMHSFEVNISFCQPENSDVHRGKAEFKG